MLQHQEIDELKRLFPGARTVLDVGCGDGEFVERLLAADSAAAGIDNDTRRVEAGRSRHLPLFTCNFPDTPGIFAVDLVTFRESIYFFDLDEVFDYLDKVLRPGGGIYIKMHVRTSFYYWRYRGWDNLVNRRYKTAKWFPFLKEVVSALRINGYEIKRQGYFRENILQGLPLCNTSLGVYIGYLLSAVVNAFGLGDRAFIYAKKRGKGGKEMARSEQLRPGLKSKLQGILVRILELLLTLIVPLITGQKFNPIPKGGQEWTSHINH